MSLSGVPYVGCDIGGFSGKSEPDVIVKYYRVALFFPIFRKHKNKFDSNQEIYSIPDKYRDEVIRTIELRYKFLQYLYTLAEEASKKGHPIIRPLCYEFYDDENAFLINDEYMVGSELLYAPQIYDDTTRLVYLPKGKWYDWWSGEEIDGKTWIKTDKEFPIFVRDIEKMKKFINKGPLDKLMR